MANIPENAAFFGDRTGDEYVQSVQVDEYGFITVMGMSNSPVFGAVNSLEWVWLMAKTHWEL